MSLKIDPVKADKQLTHLAVHDRTRIDVGDDAEVRYSVMPSAGTSRVRVSSSEDPFRALKQAEAAAASAVQRDVLGARRLTAEEQAPLAKKLATSPFGRGSSR
jgi:hypothetical protein